MVTAALGLGSNLGDRLKSLHRAATALGELGRLTGRSDVFETEPWGVEDQPRFLNACVTMELDLPPEELLLSIKKIENRMGRREAPRWGPREIDIDVLLMGDLLLETKALRIPHLNLQDREFVLVPLAQLLPDWRHPRLGLSVAEMARARASGHPPLRITAL